MKKDVKKWPQYANLVDFETDIQMNLIAPLPVCP